MRRPEPDALLSNRRLISSREFKRLMGGISEMTRWRLEKAGKGPLPVRRNGRLYYFTDEVNVYLEQLAEMRVCSKSTRSM